MQTRADIFCSVVDHAVQRLNHQAASSVFQHRYSMLQRRRRRQSYHLYRHCNLMSRYLTRLRCHVISGFLFQPVQAGRPHPKWHKQWLWYGWRKEFMQVRGCGWIAFTHSVSFHWDEMIFFSNKGGNSPTPAMLSNKDRQASQARTVTT